MCITLKAEEPFTSFHHGFWGPRVSVSLCPGGFFPVVHRGRCHAWDARMKPCSLGTAEMVGSWGGTICVQVSEVYIYFTFLDIKGDRSLLMLVETWQDVSLGWLKRLNAFRPICSVPKTVHGSETMRNLTFLCVWNDDSHSLLFSYSHLFKKVNSRF